MTWWPTSLLEADPLVFPEHRGAGLADHPITLAQGGGNVPGLEAPGLAGAHLPAQGLEDLGEEGTDEIGLGLDNSASYRLIHSILPFSPYYAYAPKL